MQRERISYSSQTLKNILFIIFKPWKTSYLLSLFSFQILENPRKLLTSHPLFHSQILKNFLSIISNPIKLFMFHPSFIPKPLFSSQKMSSLKIDKSKRFKIVARKQKSQLSMEEEATEQKSKLSMEEESKSIELVSVVFTFHKILKILRMLYNNV